MRRHTNKTNQTGFTLIEVLVTILLIGVTLVIYHGTSQSVVLNKWSRYKEIALRIADQKVQTLRTTSYSSIPASGTFTDPLISSLPDGAGTITVTDLNTKTKDVVVTVTWSNPQGTGTQQVQLETYITQGGLGQ